MMYIPSAGHYMSAIEINYMDDRQITEHVDEHLGKIIRKLELLSLLVNSPFVVPINRIVASSSAAVSVQN